MTDYTQDDLAALGLAVLFGVNTEKKDSVVNRCRAKVMAAAKKTGEHLSPEYFTTLTRYGVKADNFGLRSSGAVSSVVEHRLDTAGVTGSNPVSRTKSNLNSNGAEPVKRVVLRFHAEPLHSPRQVPINGNDQGVESTSKRGFLQQQSFHPASG